MRVAGRLAAEVLDFLTPHVQAGVTTGEIDRLAHDYMVDTQGTMPATLNYAPPGHPPYPASLCTSINHVVCHGVPGDEEAQGRRHRQHRHHRHQGRLPRRHQPHVLRRRAVDPGPAPRRPSPTRHVAGHPGGAAGRASRRHRPHDPEVRRGPRLLRRARVLRPRHRAPVPRGAAGAALRASGHRAQAAGRNDLHHRADDQRRARGDPRAGRRLDDRHGRPLAVGAVGAHGAGHRRRLRGAHGVRGHAGRRRRTDRAAPVPAAVDAPAARSPAGAGATHCAGCRARAQAGSSGAARGVSRPARHAAPAARPRAARRPPAANRLGASSARRPAPRWSPSAATVAASSFRIPTSTC